MEYLVETTYSEALTVDTENHVIHNVKVCGRQSKNGYEYSETALKSLLPLYEGVTVHVDHSPQARANPMAERTMSDGFGELRNVKLGADGAYADLHYLESHTLAPVIIERAKRMPRSFGLSHVASDFERSKRNGRMVVESVRKVHGVDIVSRPATTAGLFESFNTEALAMRMTTVKEIADSAPETTACRDFLIEMMDAGTVGEDMPVEVAEDSSPDDQIKAAFRAAVVAAFDDESLDTAATIAKIKDILKAQEKLASKPEEEPAEEEPVEEPMAESVDAIKAELARLKAKTMLLESKREASDARIKALAKADNDAERKELVESWPLVETQTEPARIKPEYSYSKNGVGGSLDFSRDPKQFAASLR